MEKSDISILDTSFIEKGEVAHMGLVDIEELLKKYPNRKIIPTHMHDNTKEIALNMSNDNFILLNDGESYEF